MRDLTFNSRQTLFSSPWSPFNSCFVLFEAILIVHKIYFLFQKNVFVLNPTGWGRDFRMSWWLLEKENLHTQGEREREKDSLIIRVIEPQWYFIYRFGGRSLVFLNIWWNGPFIPNTSHPLDIIHDNDMFHCL